MDGKLSNAGINDIRLLQQQMNEVLPKCSTLEEASQKFVTLLYEQFSSSIIVARLFGTGTFEDLPDFNKSFVTNLAHSLQVEDKINNKMLVLSLLGTRGEKMEWNDRKMSKGHIGIPLVSSEFIEKIPMMSRLLKEIGLGLDWIDSKDSDIVLNTSGLLANVFYVEDAKTAVDNKQRKIIAAQDFVSMNNVKTVFGCGGMYLGKAHIIVLIVFTRETLTKKCVEQFMPLINTFKTLTLRLAMEHKMFS